MARTLRKKVSNQSEGSHQVQCKKVPLGSGESSKRNQAGFRKYVQVLAGNADMYDNGRKATYNDQGFVAGTLELELTVRFANIGKQRYSVSLITSANANHRNETALYHHSNNDVGESQAKSSIIINAK